MPGSVLASLSDQWAHTLGDSVDAIAGYVRPEAERAQHTFLVCGRASSMLVRMRVEATSLASENAVSATASRRSMSFSVPRLLGTGVAEGLAWAGYEAISRTPHAPAARPHETVFDEIAALVESSIPRPPDTPAHWRGAHNDVTPWNLRRGRGRTWLIDWEDAGWAPPGADAVYAAATWQATFGQQSTLLRADACREARAYWYRRVRDRPTADLRLRERLLTAFAER